MIDALPSWRDLAEIVQARPGPRIVYVLGDCDTGKTTLCRFLADQRAKSQATFYLDGDPGQGELGPPTTIGAAQWPWREGQPALWRFVGATTPVGHLLQTTVGMKRLAENALAAGAQYLICDTPGFVQGEVAREFHFQLIDLLAPHVLVALQRQQELEPLLSVFARRAAPSIIRLPVSPNVMMRSTPIRQLRRKERFARYFAAARVQELDLTNLGLHGWTRGRQDLQDPNRLIALLDEQGFVLVLGLVQGARAAADRLSIFAPPFDPQRVASVQVGDPMVSRSDDLAI